MTRFRILLAIMLLSATAAQAGVAAYEACIGEGYEARVMAKYAERFPHETCTTRASCDPRLVQSAEALVRASCREAALTDCASQKCTQGLAEMWRAQGATLREDILARLAAVDFDALPALQARRLGDPARWTTERPCLGDASICAAAGQGHALGDLERVHTEVLGLE